MIMGVVSTIIDFARICRAAGLNVSPAEVLDVLGQLEWIDLAEERQFEVVLKANFLKNRCDQETFARLYDFFFHRLANIVSNRGTSTAGDKLRDLRGIVGNGVGGPSDVDLLDLLALDPLGHLDLLLKMQAVDPDISEVSLTDLSTEGVMFSYRRRNRMDTRLRELLTRDFPPGDESLRFYLQGYVRDALAEGERSEGQEGAHPFVSSLLPYKPARRGPANLGEIPFKQLTTAEARAVHTLISRLTMKYRDRITRHNRRSKKGFVDIRQTIRKSSQYEGIPMKLTWRRRPPRKPKIVALCDVSYSVWAAVPFMLNILYSLQDCFQQVHSFVFIAGIVPVNDTFARLDTMAAIDQVMDSYQLHYPGGAVYGDEEEKAAADADPEISDYGSALAEFLEKFSHVLDRRTTLIILGDGRNNFLAPRADILATIKKRCRRIVWLNPEPEGLWGDGDSEIFAYRPHLEELRPCSNLQELASFVSDLFSGSRYSNA